KSLRALNGKGRSFLFYDNDGLLIGWKVGNTLKGIPSVFFWADPWTPSDGANAAIYGAQFVFKPKYMNEEIGFVQADFPLETIVGMQTAAISHVSGARPALVLGVKTGCDGVNLYDEYSASLATPSAWVATNGAG